MLGWASCLQCSCYDDHSLAGTHTIRILQSFLEGPFKGTQTLSTMISGIGQAKVEGRAVRENEHLGPPQMF